MSHAPELLAKIRLEVERDYPPATHRYVLEKAIPNTRMFPDIHVVAEDGVIVCAVEIGYTRPEKLTQYRTVLGIRDVRWYDKQGNLHTDWEQKSVRVRVDVARPDPSQMYIYELLGQVSCGDCLESEGSPSDEKYAEYVEECQVDGVTPRTKEELYEDAVEMSVLGVESLLVTDYVKAFLPSYCDKCGKCWFADDELEGMVIYQELDNALMFRDLREFGQRYGGRITGSWKQAVELVKDEYGLTLDYLESPGYTFEDQIDQDLGDAIRIAVRAAVIP